MEGNAEKVIDQETEDFLRSWRPAPRDPAELEHWRQVIENEVRKNG